MSEETLCHGEGRRNQTHDCVSESFLGERAEQDNQVRTDRAVNEIREGSAEASNSVILDKMQDLSQDVPSAIPAENSTEKLGQDQDFQIASSQDHTLENRHGLDAKVVGLEGKNYQLGLEETSSIISKYFVSEQLEECKMSPEGRNIKYSAVVDVEVQGGGDQPSLEKSNVDYHEGTIRDPPLEDVMILSKDVSTSNPPGNISDPENIKLNQANETIYVPANAALPICIENEQCQQPDSVDSEQVSFKGIEIYPEDGTNCPITEQFEVPVEVISSHYQLEAQFQQPTKNSGRSGHKDKRTSKVMKKKYALRSSLGTDRALRSRSLEKSKVVELNNEEDNATSGEKKRRTRRKKSSETKNTPNEYSRIRKNLSYMLNRIRYEQSLIDAYSSEGWKGLSLEKLKPEKEIQRAKSEIVRRKLKIRDLFQRLDLLCAEGRLPEDLFDSEGMISSEDIFCAKCGSKDLTLDNDIILCDGICERGFHQFCLEPPLHKEDFPPDDEGWLCPGCDCKVDCVDLLNESQGKKLTIGDSWEKVFPEAVKAGNLDPSSAISSDDSEDDDYDPEKPQDDEEGGGETSSDDSEYATASDKSHGEPTDKQDVGLPSEDSEDDDYDPDAPDLDKVKKESSSSDFTSDSEDLADALVDEGSIGGKKETQNDELQSVIEPDTAESGATPISAKRHVQRLDYKKLHDEEYGGTSSDSSGDEDWFDNVETRKRKQHTEVTEVIVKRSRGRPKSVGTNTSADIPCKDSLKSDSSGAKAQPSVKRLGEEVKQRLHSAFNTNHFPDRATKESLAQELGITYQQVDKWFGNARWFFNHPAGRKANVPGKKPRNDSVPEPVTKENIICNGDANAGKPESSFIPESTGEDVMDKMLESPEGNRKGTSGKRKNSKASGTPDAQSADTRTRTRRRCGSYRIQD